MNNPTQAPSKDLVAVLRGHAKAWGVTSHTPDEDVMNETAMARECARAADFIEQRLGHEPHPANPTEQELHTEIERLQALLALETGALEQACAAPVDAPLTVEQARAAHEPPADTKLAVKVQERIDYHDNQESTADAMGCDQSAKFHHAVRKELEELQRPFTEKEAKAYRAFLDDFFDQGAAQPPSPEWQPIEAAPKDGRKFLAVHNGRAFICSWATGINGWMDAAGAGLHRDPTWWMPLPSPPTKSAESP